MFGFAAGGLGEIAALRGEDDRARRTDDHAPSAAILAGLDGGRDVATLRADAGDEDRQIADEST
ncbi:MAG: hypothetical protein J2P31_19920, partial [Blastocatellia bacterium]|nr:hypothetical protein [Blastocatellia bacterium]